MGFVDLLKERAKKSIKTIVLPETEDMRTIEATDKILKEGGAERGNRVPVLYRYVSEQLFKISLCVPALQMA